tara:strand:- start:20158 stop:20454 length:297 start_codon:yes stop_codon:yes gene_type:complete
MTKLPEKIWAKDHRLGSPEDKSWWHNDDIGGTEYTRSDIANAAVVDLIAQNAELIKRIAELEAAVEEIYLEYDPSDHGGISEIMFDLASAVRAKGATT